MANLDKNDPRIQQHLQNYLRELPIYTPQEMMDKIGTFGYIGQERAKKALSLMAYRHINRLKKIYLQSIKKHHLPAKENYLMLGPTGCGKTYLIDILFNQILQLPTVIIDITAYSETGYVGQDAVAMLTRLVYAADKDPFIASLGIVCMDEFDKLSSGKNNAVFSGAGTTKDVSGIGVQRELLKMLEGAEIDVPMNLSHSSYSERVTFSTHNVAFIASGAFSGFKGVVNKEKSKGIGFGKKQAQEEKEGTSNKIAVSYSKEDVARTSYFESYGMMPELIGRFSRIIPFKALGKSDLKNILQNNTIHQYAKEFALEGVKLHIAEDVLDHIVADAIKRETGARALKYSLLEYLEDACFEMYSTKKTVKEVKLYKEKDEIKWDLMTRKFF